MNRGPSSLDDIMKRMNLHGKSTKTTKKKPADKKPPRPKPPPPATPAVPHQSVGMFQCRIVGCTARLPICRLYNHVRQAHPDELTVSEVDLLGIAAKQAAKQEKQKKQASVELVTSTTTTGGGGSGEKPQPVKKAAETQQAMMEVEGGSASKKPAKTEARSDSYHRRFEISLTRPLRQIVHIRHAGLFYICMDLASEEDNMAPAETDKKATADDLAMEVDDAASKAEGTAAGDQSAATTSTASGGGTVLPTSTSGETPPAPAAKKPPKRATHFVWVQAACRNRDARYFTFSSQMYYATPAAVVAKEASAGVASVETPATSSVEKKPTTTSTRNRDPANKWKASYRSFVFGGQTTAEHLKAKRQCLAVDVPATVRGAVLAIQIRATKGSHEGRRQSGGTRVELEVGNKGPSKKKSPPAPKKGK